MLRKNQTLKTVPLEVPTLTGGPFAAAAALTQPTAAWPPYVARRTINVLNIED